MTFSTADIRSDGFLDGRLQIAQPRAGYRAGTDAVMLAAACPAATGDSVLELGCGAGAALLCLGARVPGLNLTGLEVQPDYADLARANAAANGLAAEVLTGDLSRMPASLSGRSFDHVLMNPPYFSAGPAAAGGRGLARHQAAPVSDWIGAGLRRLVPGGWLTAIQHADRLAEVLATFGDKAGDLRVLPIAARAHRPAGRIIVAGRKGTRGPLRLLAPFVLHAHSHHAGDGDDWTAAATAVLRHGGAISLEYAEGG